jgi:hypothetical protein
MIIQYDNFILNHTGMTSVVSCMYEWAILLTQPHKNYDHI